MKNFMIYQGFQTSLEPPHLNNKLNKKKTWKFQVFFVPLLKIKSE
jgi:hypothetical protein